MPFQSENQRRYMHANLPEIAQRWEREYANGGIASQGGMNNYMGQQPMVNAPKYWQSAPDHEMTELAYITPQERDTLVNMDMYGTMEGGPNQGPSGIMSLNGWGDKGEGFADKSFAGQERPGRAVQVTTGSPHGQGPQTVTRRTKTVSPKDTFAQSWTGPKRFFGLTGGYRDLKVPGDTSQGHKSRFNPLGMLLGAINPALGLAYRGFQGLKDFGNPKHKTLADWWGSRKGWGVEEEEEDVTSDYKLTPEGYQYVGGSMEDTLKEFRQKHPVDPSKVNLPSDIPASEYEGMFPFAPYEEFAPNRPQPINPNERRDPFTPGQGGITNTNQGNWFQENMLPFFQNLPKR